MRLLSLAEASLARSSAVLASPLLAARHDSSIRSVTWYTQIFLMDTIYFLGSENHLALHPLDLVLGRLLQLPLEAGGGGGLPGLVHGVEHDGGGPPRPRSCARVARAADTSHWAGRALPSTWTMFIINIVDTK